MAGATSKGVIEVLVAGDRCKHWIVSQELFPVQARITIRARAVFGGLFCYSDKSIQAPFASGVGIQSWSWTLQRIARPGQVQVEYSSTTPNTDRTDDWSSAPSKDLLFNGA